MAKGPSPCRRKGRSRPSFLRLDSECSSQSAKALTDGNNNHHLDQSIKQALQRRGGKQVKAFVVMALHEDGDISTHTTDHVQQCTDSIFASDAGDCLRYAHRSSLLEAQSAHGHQDQDLISPPAFGEPTAYNFYRNDPRQIRAKQPADNFHGLPTPLSARAPRSNNDWHSDADDYDSAQAIQTEESQHQTTSSSSRPAQLQSLHICESTKVQGFLGKRLRTMQQLAVKRIAKAWIKGICPKKQATFPYHKKRREREGLDHLNDFSGYIPGWWPDTSVCRFVEPDHIKRDERINLCLHLLRLRPTPAQLKEWNKGCIEPHQTHVTKGWTEFLKELAPPAMFDENREQDDKTEERSKLLAQVYELAKREEEYQDGEIDGDDRYWWQADVPEERPQPKKKGRRSYDSSVDDSEAESGTDSAPPSKRSKKASVATSPAHSPVTSQWRDVNIDDRMQDCKPTAIEERSDMSRRMAQTYPPSNSSNSPHGPWSQGLPHDSKAPSLHSSMHERSQMPPSASGMPHAYSTEHQWVANSSPASYPTSTTSGSQPMPQAFAMEVPTSTFPGRHDYRFSQQGLAQPQTGVDQACPPYAAAHFSQPQFESLPVTTMYAPPASLQSPHIGQQAEQQQQLYNGPMYYGQPPSAQPYLPMPGTPDPSTQLNIAPPSNMSFRPCTPGPAQCYTVDPTNYQHHPHTTYQYPEFHHGDDFQAAARVERGFTGHGSGVGGGAHT